MSFFVLLFFFQFFEHVSDFFASTVLQNKKISWQKIHFFLFSPLCFTLMFPVLFFLSLCFCQLDLLAEDKPRHEEKWVEATKENALADDFWLGLAAIVCFLWLSDLCVTQTARGTPASECLSSSPYVFSLSLHFYSLYVHPPSSTRGKKLLERLGNFRRWSCT